MIPSFLLTPRTLLIMTWLLSWMLLLSMIVPPIRWFAAMVACMVELLCMAYMKWSLLFVRRMVCIGSVTRLVVFVGEILMW